MKANELMIGDLVHCIADDAIHKILRLNIKEYIPFMEGSEWYADEKDRANVLSDVEPIPLTEDMLKANGFEYDGCFWNFVKKMYDENGDVRTITTIIRFVLDEDYDVSDRFWGHWIFDESYRLDNVHELQHALRLCGLSSIADNFVIEKQTDDKGNKEAS